MKYYMQKFRHAWVFSYMIVYLSWFYWLEQRQNVNYTIIETRLDHWIPFNEYFVIPYILWFFYVFAAIAFFFFRDISDFYKLAAMLGLGMTISLIIYTIWPNAQDLRPESFIRQNFFTNIVQRLYQIDTSTNICPSIHVYNSIAVHISIAKSKHFENYRWIRTLSFVLMISICLSTVFLKQHSVVDGICAAILAWILYLFVYKIDYSFLFSEEREHETHPL